MGSLKREIRVARAEAERVFGSRAAAKEWLESECQALGFVRPIDLLHDSEGLIRVLTVLRRIERGVFT